MKHDVLIRATICVYAPAMLVEKILLRHLDILVERCPALDIRINPAQAMLGTPRIEVSYEKPLRPGLTTRSLGEFGSRQYQCLQTGAVSTFPDIIAGLDATLVPVQEDETLTHQTLWMSFDPEIQLLPGMRQTLDWIESCVISRSWLNETSVGHTPLSP